MADASRLRVRCKNLLVEPDVTRITSPVLKRETMDKVLGIIRSEIKDGSVTIDNPTQNLESYFLGVVEKARASEESTSGALAGKVADYLKGTAEEQTSSRDKVLDRLTQAEGKQDAKPHVEAPAEKVDHGKLDQLTQDSSEAGQSPKLKKLRNKRQILMRPMINFLHFWTQGLTKAQTHQARKKTDQITCRDSSPLLD
jgi:hypothetical protein